MPWSTGRIDTYPVPASRPWSKRDCRLRSTRGERSVRATTRSTKSSPGSTRSSLAIPWAVWVSRSLASSPSRSWMSVMVSASLVPRNVEGRPLAVRSVALRRTRGCVSPSNRVGGACRFVWPSRGFTVQRAARCGRPAWPVRPATEVERAMPGAFRGSWGTRDESPAGGAPNGLSPSGRSVRRPRPVRRPGPAPCPWEAAVRFRARTNARHRRAPRPGTKTPCPGWGVRGAGRRPG